jgi:hypothetical protein
MSHPTILVYAPTDVLFTGEAGEGHACNCEPRFILVPRARVPVVGEAKITFCCGIVISLAGSNNCAPGGWTPGKCTCHPGLVSGSDVVCRSFAARVSLRQSC